MNKLEGKVALITGGDSGIGLATARRFAAEGATVYITGRRQQALDTAVREIGQQATGIQGDVAQLADLDRLYAQVRQRHARIDVLFANAGVGEHAALGEITEAHYDNTFNVNVKGMLFTVQKALPLLKDGASIILSASIVASKGWETLSVYSATKAAIRSFARTWTADLHSRKIRVNAISPGTINTPGSRSLEGGEQNLARFGAAIPLGRLGDPDDIAKAVVFLASDDSSYITGTELFIDGGMAQI
jgi:NAD(P)-dependent dehydrogenase (short-subunit alcohol dehydrogenase family)